MSISKLLAPSLSSSLAGSLSGGAADPSKVTDERLPSAQDLVTVENSSAGTIIVETPYTGAPVGDEVIARLNIDVNNFILIESTSAGSIVFTVQAGGVTVYTESFDGTYVLDQGTRKLSISWALNNISVSIDGIISGTETSAAAPTGTTTTLSIGQDEGGGSTYGDTINRIQYFNARKTDAQIRALAFSDDLGVSVTRDASLNIILGSGQSNSSKCSATVSRSDVEISNLSDLRRIKVQGGIDTPSGITVNASGTLFTALQQGTSALDRNLLIASYIQKQIGGNVAVGSFNRGSTGLVAGGSNGLWGDAVVSTKTKMSVLKFSLIEYERHAAAHGVLYQRIWHQGETDANNGVTEAQYETGLTTLLDDLNTYNSVDTIIVGLHDQPPANHANWPDIQAAQSDIATARNDADLVSAVGVDVVVSDEVHIEVDGQLDLTHDIAAQILFNKGEISATSVLELDISQIPALKFAGYANEALASGTAWTRLAGEADFTEATNPPAFDATLFGGKGGYVVEDSADTMELALSGAIGDVIFQAYAVDVPAVLSASATIFAGDGTGIGGADFQTIFSDSNGRPVYQKNQAEGNTNLLFSNLRGQKNLFVLDTVSTTQVDGYINSLTENTSTLDPKDIYNATDNFTIFGEGANATAGYAYRSAIVSSQSPLSAYRTKLIQQLADDAGITV